MAKFEISISTDNPKIQKAVADLFTLIVEDIEIDNPKATGYEMQMNFLNSVGLLSAQMILHANKIAFEFVREMNKEKDKNG